MCCHNAIKLFVEKNRARTFNEGIKEGGLSAETIIKRWSIPTASMFYRKEYDAYPAWLVQIYSGDMALYLRCLAGGDIYYFDDIMSVYRYNTEGDSSSARLKGKRIFVLEQHNLLLDSFNKGTNGKFDLEISDRINKNRRKINYLKRKEKGILYCIFDSQSYRVLLNKIISAVIKKQIHI